MTYCNPLLDAFTWSTWLAVPIVVSPVPPAPIATGDDPAGGLYKSALVT